MQGMLKDAKPDRFEDIIALVALYRPGPMDLIPDFCRRKHGEKFEYPDERTKGILSETYGIMVYQEQVMQMAQVIGGYTLGGADLLRRAMGKKDANEMARHRQIFRDGAAKNDLTEAKADEIFDLMEKFARLWFQQVACGCLRIAVLPDGLFEATPCRRVHGSQYVAGDGRYRQGKSACRRCR